MSTPKHAIDRVERFVEAWDRRRDSDDEILSLHMFVEEDEGRSLLASDLRELVAHIDALQDRVDSLPEDPCPTCGAVRCACAYDRPNAVCGYHARIGSREEENDG